MEQKEIKRISVTVSKEDLKTLKLWQIETEYTARDIIRVAAELIRAGENPYVILRRRLDEIQQCPAEGTA